MDELFNTQPKVTRYRPTVLGTRQFALLTIGYILELLPVPSLFRGQLELTPLESWKVSRKLDNHFFK